MTAKLVERGSVRSLDGIRQALVAKATVMPGLRGLVEKAGQDASSPRKKIQLLLHAGLSNREMYLAGEQEGEKQEARTLMDVLYFLDRARLGRAAIVQESNNHVLFKVFDCACCRGQEVLGRCHYVAGFLAGVMKATRKYDNARVKELSCGEYPGHTCLFQAAW